MPPAAQAPPPPRLPERALEPFREYVAPSARLDAVRDALRKGAWRDARCLKRDGHSFTWIGALDTPAAPVRVVVKATPVRPGLAGALAQALWRTRARRQITGARRLTAAGFEAPKPLLLFLLPRAPAARASEWLVLPYTEGRTLIDLLFDDALPLDDRLAVARDVGKLVRSMARANLLNRDLKPSNLVRTLDGALVQIDTVGVRRSRKPDLALRMLSALLFEPHGLGALPSRSLRWRLLEAAVEDPRAAWRALERALAAHGDTNPKDDPRA